MSTSERSSPDTLTPESIPDRRCVTCRRRLPASLEYFGSTWHWSRSGRLYLRQECRECARAYRERVRRLEALRNRVRRIRPDLQCLATIETASEFVERWLQFLHEIDEEGCSLREWCRVVIEQRECGYDLGRKPALQLMQILMRSHMLAEDYLLLLAGQEPKPDGELSELIRDELGEIPQPEKPLAPLPPAPQPEKPKPEPPPDLDAVESETLESALAELLAEQDWSA